MALNVLNRIYEDKEYLDDWIAQERTVNNCSYEVYRTEPVINKSVQFADEPDHLVESIPLQPRYTRELSETYSQIEKLRTNTETKR